MSKQHTERDELIAALRQQSEGERKTVQRLMLQAAALLAEDKAGGEPVAKVMQHEHVGLTVNNLIDTDLPCGTLLYTHPQQAEAVRVPEGYALVPVEPTQPMRNAGNKTLDMLKTEQGMGIADRAFYAYHAMLAAAMLAADKAGGEAVGWKEGYAVGLRVGKGMDARLKEDAFLPDGSINPKYLKP